MIAQHRLPVYIRVVASTATILVVTTFGVNLAAATLETVKVFTKTQNHYSAGDANSKFTGQVNWANPKKPMAWSFRLSPAVRAIATSNMTCTAKVPSFPRYGDTHVIPSDYLWHSTVPGPHRMSTSWYYVLNGNCTFRVSVGGETGTANLTFRFDYRFSDVNGALTPRGTSDVDAVSSFKSHLHVQLIA